jgi:GNAT superfamily N-acetyltransferase
MKTIPPRPYRFTVAFTLIVLAASLSGCRHAAVSNQGAAAERFQIAMIPDTQNYVDYTHQSAVGFAFDASEQFIAQMAWIAERSRARGGDIAFVASVGDVWQHQSLAIDPAHEGRGLGRLEKSFFGDHFAPTEAVFEVEIPKAIEGYALIDSARIPFGVAPGNHDYDAMWNVVGFAPNFEKPRSELTFTPEDIGMLHIGGLDNFRSAFGDDTPFFENKDWYVASFRGGANSAQVFEGGGYRFLHFALEMSPDDEVLAWAQTVIDAHPDHPTIISTHDYLDRHGRRRANPIVDLARVDPDHHNTADQIFEKLIAPNDQIFLVLCGHHHGQALRIDRNEAGHAVIQILADYQDRGQSGLDAGQPRDEFFGGPVGIGDGWFRLLDFDLGAERPRLSVRTYSSHYETYSIDLPSYVAWYRDHEQPGMSDVEFHAADEFEIELTDFRARFRPDR